LFSGLVRANTVVSRDVLEGRGVEGLERLAGHHLRVLGKAELAGDGAGGRAMVAGDHDDPDAGAVAFADRGDRFLARRVDEADEAEQGRVVLHVGERQVRWSCGIGLVANARMRWPWLARASVRSRQASASSGSGPSSPIWRLHMARMRSGAPLR
jgi:hypothetical protein